MMKMLTGSALAALALTSAGAAQDYAQSPSFGSVTLSGGFSPDPYTVQLRSGGSIDASSRLGAQGCRGFIANAPDFRLNFTPDMLPLIISVAASEDTTLVINGPDERWYCNDDGGEGLNPSYRFSNPQAGQYDIWVGTYGGAAQLPATLHISEVSSR